MSNLTAFEEDIVPTEDTAPIKAVSKNSSTTDKRSGIPWGTILAILAAAGVVAAIVASVWWILFAPTPTDNVVEAAEIIENDISSTMSNAAAFQITENPLSNAAMLTVETSEGTCKAYSIYPNGNYQAFESEGRIAPESLQFEDMNYGHVHLADSSSPAFEYYHSEDELQHGIYANLIVGQYGAIDPRSIDVSEQYDANLDTSDESFCF